MSDSVEFDGIAVGGPRDGIRILSGRARFTFPTVTARTSTGRILPKQGEYHWDHKDKVWIWHGNTHPANK